MPIDATAATFVTFYGSEGRLGQAFLTGAGVNRCVKSVHNLIVSTGIPATAPKMRKQFGHTDDNQVNEGYANVPKPSRTANYNATSIPGLERYEPTGGAHLDTTT
jgi:hypothetical protein